MKNIKFVVRVNRSGTRAPEYVQRVDPTPIHMTTNRKLALVMGKFTAEDAVKSLQTSQCSPELVPVEVTAQHASMALQDQSFAKAAEDAMAEAAKTVRGMKQVRVAEFEWNWTARRQPNIAPQARIYFNLEQQPRRMWEADNGVF